MHAQLGITRILAEQDLSAKQFVERFERPRLPVVITGLCDSWRGQENWTAQNLLRHYGEHKFKVQLKKLGTSALAILLQQSIAVVGIY